MDPTIRGVLTRHLKFGVGELDELERGAIVKHSIDTTAPGEIAVAGGVRVNVSKDRFLARLRDIVRFKQGDDIVQIGRFSNPPALGDLAPLTVDSSDFDPRDCRVGDCGVRLPADAIRRAAQELDVNAPDLQQRASAWFKQILLDNVTAYVSGRGARMAQYDDGSAPPIRPLDEFAAMMKNTPAIAALVPGLAEHLREFPHRPVSGAEDFLYWSKEKFGMAPFITVTHVTIVCASPRTCVATTKDVYSSRYLDASLALTIATDAGSQNAIYLVYANRSRANALKGLFSGMRRAIAERRARGGLEASLKTLKERLEKG
jgi:hypothetical protein